MAKRRTHNTMAKRRKHNTMAKTLELFGFPIFTL
jgi:hypothetical protein